MLKRCPCISNTCVDIHKHMNRHVFAITSMKLIFVHFDISQNPLLVKQRNNISKCTINIEKRSHALRLTCLNLVTVKPQFRLRI